MEIGAYQKHYEIEKDYWWFSARRLVSEKILKLTLGSGVKNIVEIGCGTGGNLEMLGRFGKTLGLDIAPEALSFCKMRGLNNVALMLGEYNSGLADGSQDLVCLFDVLEHFEDDGKALNEIYRILKPDGVLILTVPAFPFLWSGLDKELHHYRRYRKSGLQNRVESAGLSIVKLSYFFFFVFPLIIIYRVVLKRDQNSMTYIRFPRLVNSMYVFLSQVEAFILNFINLPFGSSLILIGRKKV